jgi:hypothetical protein
MSKLDITTLDDTAKLQLVEARWTSSSSLWDIVERVYKQNTAIFSESNIIKIKGFLVAVTTCLYGFRAEQGWQELLSNARHQVERAGTSEFSLLQMRFIRGLTAERAGEPESFGITYTFSPRAHQRSEARKGVERLKERASGKEVSPPRPPTTARVRTPSLNTKQVLFFIHGRAGEASKVLGGITQRRDEGVCGHTSQLA